MTTKNIALTLGLLALSLCAVAAPPEGSVYLEGDDGQAGLILAHGKGRHPRWLVVEPLRKGVNRKLGYHTLSLQMPTGYSDWKDYADAFPDAHRTIREAIAYLREEKGASRVFLFGHSMGSRMASAFVSGTPDHGLAGLIVAGCRNNGGQPLSCDQNLRTIDLPVLDIWGGKNGKDSRAAAERRGMLSGSYRQEEIVGANHKFERYEDELVDTVVVWLEKQY